jgi:hypothetical protein
MAAPRFAPTSPVDDPRSYGSPDHVPTTWLPDRPADIVGFQPVGARLGFQGPDQGFGLKIANGFRDRLHLAPGESADDVVAGCLGVGLRRASMFSRAPVVHDFTIAFTIFGFLDAAAPTELVQMRVRLFEGVTSHHGYEYKRNLVDMVPETTLRMTPAQVQAAYPGRWAELVGA